MEGLYTFFFTGMQLSQKCDGVWREIGQSLKVHLLSHACVTPFAIASARVAVSQLPLLSRCPLKHKGEDEGEVEAQIPRS